jgi:hypothetical protein
MFENSHPRWREKSRCRLRALNDKNRRCHWFSNPAEETIIPRQIRSSDLKIRDSDSQPVCLPPPVEPFLVARQGIDERARPW